MVTITREQAICMFCCEKCTEDNIARLSKRVDWVKTGQGVDRDDGVWTL